MQPEYILDGERFDTLEEFYIEIGRVLVGSERWGKNLDALNDLLRGDFGLIRSEFRLVWQHAKRSRVKLGYTETVRQLTTQLRDCHPQALIKRAWALRAALRGCAHIRINWTTLMQAFGLALNISSLRGQFIPDSV